jgi:hypothetical protein
VQPVLDRWLRNVLGKRLPGVDLVAVAETGRRLVDVKPRGVAELGRLLVERWPGQDPSELSDVVRGALPLVKTPPRAVLGQKRSGHGHQRRGVARPATGRRHRSRPNGPAVLPRLRPGDRSASYPSSTTCFSDTPTAPASWPTSIVRWCSPSTASSARRCSWTVSPKSLADHQDKADGRPGDPAVHPVAGAGAGALRGREGGRPDAGLRGRGCRDPRRTSDRPVKLAAYSFYMSTMEDRS